MNINPYILLSIGVTFALLYAFTITIGWWRTRINRRLLQKTRGVSLVRTLRLDKTIRNVPDMVETISLENNEFVDANGYQIIQEHYEAYIAVGESEEYPGISNGDLLFIDSSGNIKYVFTVPNLKRYR